jgi:CubicO group peptidase (beta-lactamase class C family)
MYHDPPPVFRELRYLAALTLAEVVGIGSQQPIDFDPGTAWQYSDIGFAVLGRIIEVVSGQAFNEFVESRVFVPLGMNDSFFFPPPDKSARIATPYVLKEGKLARMASDTWGGGDLLYRKGTKYSFPEGGVYSTAKDLAAFYQMFLNGGLYNGHRILAKSSVHLMTEVHTGNLPAGHEPGTGYGFGWEVVKDPVGSAVLPGESIGSYWHAGAFGTYGWVDPAKDLFGILLIQRSPGSAFGERNAFVSIVNSAITKE